MPSYKCTGKNIVKVLRKFADDLEKQSIEQKRQAAISIEEALNDLMSEYFFGTEGQFDPRGDRRD